MSSRYITLSILKDELPLWVWLACGAGIQSLIAYFTRFSPLLPLTCLFAFAGSVLVTQLGWQSNDAQADVTWGKLTALIPSPADDNGPVSADIDLTDAGREPPSSDATAAAPLTVFMVGFESHHAAGRFAPGMREMISHILAIWTTADTARVEYGFLGRTTPLIGTGHNRSNALYVLSYWRSPEHLRRFAQSTAHQKALTWWFREAGPTGRYRHIGIMHETWHCEAGGWENVYGNFRRFGMAMTEYPLGSTDNEKGSTKTRGPVIVTSGKRLLNMTSRMG